MEAAQLLKQMKLMESSPFTKLHLEIVEKQLIDVR
jgi:hypothetical protein